MFPHALDFSTVRIVSERAGRSGAIDYNFAPDHIDITVKREAVGSTHYEIVLAFESAGFPDLNRFGKRWSVACYQWDKSAIDSDNDIRTAQGWQHVLTQPPIHQARIDRLDIRADDTPYRPRRKPFGTDVPLDWFALVAESRWTLPAGTYEIALFNDDGVRVYVDEELVIDDWSSGATRSNRKQLPFDQNGTHTIRVEYFQWDGSLRLMFSIRRILPEPAATGGHVKEAQILAPLDYGGHTYVVMTQSV